MAQAEFTGSGTADDPWVLYTPSLGSQIQMHRDEDHIPPLLVCTVGKTVLHYDLRVIDDLHQMLVDRGGWVELGNADEQKPVKEGTVEAWARSDDNPIGGWYGLKKGLRGRVGNYVPRCWKPWVWLRWNTSPGATGCGRYRDVDVRLVGLNRPSLPAFASLLFAAVVGFETLTLMDFAGGLAFKLVPLIGFDPLPLMTGGALLVRLVM